ncbi:hypothetical protein [Sphingomonas montana]|nr:hypothetical protein [Sphingomonas montana]
MIDGASTLSPGSLARPAPDAPPAMSSLRFFLTAYAGGFVFFLAILL